MHECEENLKDLQQALRDTDKDIQWTERNIGQLRDLVGLVPPPRRDVETGCPDTYTTSYGSSDSSLASFYS